MKLTLSKVKHETIVTISFTGGESKRNYYRETKCKSIFIVLSINLLFDRQYRSDSLKSSTDQKCRCSLNVLSSWKTKTYRWEFFSVFSLNHSSSVACLTNSTSAVYYRYYMLYLLFQYSQRPVVNNNPEHTLLLLRFSFFWYSIITRSYIAGSIDWIYNHVFAVVVGVILLLLFDWHRSRQSQYSQQHSR